jgi:hypothetical protein
VQERLQPVPERGAAGQRAEDVVRTVVLGGDPGPRARVGAVLEDAVGIGDDDAPDPFDQVGPDALGVGR